VVNDLRSEQIWPSNVEHCPQSWALAWTRQGKALCIWLLPSIPC